MSSEVVEEKATTVFEHVYSARASDSNTRTGYDNSGGILFRTTVSYTSEYYNGRTYYDMRQIDGGYTRYDTTINVVSQRLDYGQNGFIKSGGTNNTDKKIMFPYHQATGLLYHRQAG